MYLIDGRKVRIRVECCDCKPPVPGDCLGIVMASEADIKSGARTNRNASAPPKKSVWKLPEADSTDYIYASPLNAHRYFRMMISSSA